MRRFLLSVMVLAAMCVAAFGSSLSFTLSPSTEFLPPGANPAQCETNGVGPYCVMFSGTLTDNDTDQSIINLNNLTITLNPAFFTLDNTFFNDVPGGLSGDVNYAADGLPFPNTYTGLIFGIDIAPSTPPGTYNGTVEIQAAGGTNDPNYNGFAVDQSFTVVVTPEPVSTGLVIGGLIVLATLRRRTQPC